MKHQAKKLTCGVLASLLSSSLAGCGVTSEVATTHPSSSLPIGPPPTAQLHGSAADAGRPRAPRPGAEEPTARVLTHSAAVAPVAAPATTAAALPSPAAAAPLATSADLSTLTMRNMRTQSGRIIDEAGQPLVGATVLLRGTSRGASTDANGDYSLAVPLGTNTFVFGYSGYEDEVAQSRDGQPLTVTLLPAAGQPPVASPEKENKPRRRKKRR